MNRGQFQKGQPRPSGAGRKKGSKNKYTYACELIEAAGLDPVEGMIEMAKDGSLDDSLRFNVLKELAQYKWQKLRPYDVEAAEKKMREEAAGMSSEDLAFKALDGISETQFSRESKKQIIEKLKILMAQISDAKETIKEVM